MPTVQPYECSKCGVCWGPVTGPKVCPECGAQSTALVAAVAFLNGNFEPWTFTGAEPVSLTLAEWLVNWRQLFRDISEGAA